jgi:uncharacterized protein YprB with RNaseH-like and TPR domain
MLTTCWVCADHDTAREALARRTQFNVIDMATGWKADLIVRSSISPSSTLWRKHERGDRRALDTLIEYTREDVMNLASLAHLVSKEMPDCVGFQSA